MPRALFIESIEGTMALFTRGLLAGAHAAGWETTVVFMRDRSERLRSSAALASEIRAAAPDLVVFLMDAPLALPDLWEQVGAGAPRASLWFDDYLRSPATLGGTDVWIRWQAEHRVRVFFWDGHWRARWQGLTGHAALPIHLAADPKDFDPGARAWKPDWSDRCVSVGTIPSRASLDAQRAALPAALHGVIDSFIAGLATAPWPIRAYELWAAALDAASPKVRAVAGRWLSGPANSAVTHQLVWRWGKRVARLRGLRAALQAGPVGVLSGHRTESYADGDEIRAELGADRNSLDYEDTRHLGPGSWSGLFRSGRIQLQITDPQSVEGGLPFRVFECAASAARLISDTRPELETWCGGTDAVRLAADERAIGMRVAEALAEPETKMGTESLRAHHERFLKRDTWAARFREIAAAAAR
jgi:hypothetical protein